MRNMKKAFIKDQKEKLGSGRIGRRQFITSMLAAGVVLPAAMTMATDVMAMTPKRRQATSRDRVWRHDRYD